MDLINAKLDNILDTLNNRMDKLEENIEKNAKKLNEIEESLSLRCSALEGKVQTLVEITDFEDLKEKVKEFEELRKLNAEKIITLNSKLTRLTDEVNSFQKYTAHELLAKEIYDKRFNILVYGIEENKDKSWESKYESEEKFRAFLSEALKIPNKHKISLADVHRLPQHTVSKHGKRITRPIIAKLTSSTDKNLIMRSLKNLREHNLQRKTEHGDSAEYVYVTNHLPIELQKQKKRLLPVFKAARKDGKKATWKIENSSCNLYIDNVRYCESP